MLECVVNISEGRDPDRLASLAAAVPADLLDVHTDADHHRTVFTLVGERAPRALASRAIELLDLRPHDGAHPRLGVVDVVPFVPLAGSSMEAALAAREEFATWLAAEHGVPVFLYGPERPLPEVRRRAFRDLSPDMGPNTPHPTAGATCVGARPPLVAYNVWLADVTVSEARAIAAAIRRPALRALGLAVGDAVQVSMNLVAPREVGPAEAFDLVAAQLAGTHGAVDRSELVGLLPEAVLQRTPEDRWEALDLSADRTIEARLRALGPL
ncbi:MAG: glutamate formiminotransferase [Acidimicrobiales bacterium]